MEEITKENNALASPHAPEREQRSGLPAAALNEALNAVVGASLRPVSAAFGVLYAIYAASHMILLPPTAALPLTLTAVGTSLALWGLYFVLHRWSPPSSWAHPFGAAIASAVLLNSTLHLVVLSDPQQTTNLMLLLLGAGCLFLSPFWLTVTIGVTWLAWGCVAWGALPSPAWRHFGFGLLAATTLSIVVHAIRVRVFTHLENLRAQNESRRGQLEEAQADLEARVQERTAKLVAVNAALRTEIIDRQQAEKALRESEEKYRELVENINDVLYVQDAAGQISYISPIVESLSGYRLSEILGRSFTEFIHPEDLPELLASAQRTLAGQLEPSEFRIITKSSAIRWARSSSRPIRQGEQVIGLRGVITDITDRKRAEMQTKALLAVAEDISGTLQLQELLDRVQRRTAEILSCDLVGTFYWDAEREVFRLISHYGIAETLRPFATSLAFPIGEPFGGQVAEGHTVVVNEVSGQSRLLMDLFAYFHITALVAVPLRVHGRHLGSLVACATTHGRRFDADQVELCKGIAQQLAVAIEAAELYRQQQEDAEVASMLARFGQEMIASLKRPGILEKLCQLTVEALSGDCSCTFLRQPEREVYKSTAHQGLTREQQEIVSVLELPSQVISDLLSHFDDDEIAELENPRTSHFVPSTLLQQCDIASAIFLHLRRGQETIGFQICGYRQAHEFTARHRRIARGVAQIASLALVNVKLLEELERANRIKEDFLGTMSHELRTPLSIVIGYTQLMAEEAFGPLTVEQTDILSRVNKNTRELLDLISATLDLSRLQNQQRLSLSVHPVQGDMLLAELETEMRQLHQKPAVKLEWRVASDLPLFYTDAVKLKMVLKNLITNAMKFTDMGVITIAVQLRHDGVEFSVTDTGIGIPPDSLPAIFEPFRQLDNSSTRRHGGVGLGLYIVRQLVEILSGKVTVESEVGKGSVFRVWTPLTLRQNDSMSQNRL